MKIDGVRASRDLARGTRKYILFTGDSHESVRFDYTEYMINKFIDLWNDGVSIQQIALDLQINHVSVALLVMDLEMAGRIQPRDGGLSGKKKVVS